MMSSSLLIFRGEEGFLVGFCVVVGFDVISGWLALGKYRERVLLLRWTSNMKNLKNRTHCGYWIYDEIFTYFLDCGMHMDKYVTNVTDVSTPTSTIATSTKAIICMR